MPSYKAPLKDIRFLMYQVLGFPGHYQSCGYGDVGMDVIDPVIQEAARFAQEVLDPTRQEGDREGTHLETGGVVTPAGYKRAWQAFRDAQWNGLSCQPRWEGQGLPHSLGMIFHELAESANMPWCSLFTLTQGAIRAIEAHASDALKSIWLPPMVAGQWTGTMALTEPHCGSDVGLLRTRAEPAGDGCWTLHGTKMFITWADQDLTENIVHLVLARLPDAPAGPRGISLFLVPKFLLDAQGKPSVRNHLSVASLEEKMGLHSSPTCVVNLDGATGWLVGEPHQGLAAMFTMMNAARLDVAFEALGISQLSHQGAVEYARDRLQMRAPGGAKYPSHPADPIIVHPDVRRMLLTQKALVEGCRALGYFTAMQLDIALQDEKGTAGDEASQLIALLTPICKGFITERGTEVADLGVQVLGGHGYVREWGMEQLCRDVRITRIYEGTNGIQAIDLMKRKLLGSQGKLPELLLQEMSVFCDQHQGLGGVVGGHMQSVADLIREWREVNALMLADSDDADRPFSAAFDYLEYCGYVALAWCWARMAVAAAKHINEPDADRSFLEAKLVTASFYFSRILPRRLAVLANLKTSAQTLMALSAEQFFMP